MIIEVDKILKPFIKWAGGKSQLIEKFVDIFPTELKDGTIKNYFEPFLGGGSVFFHIAQKYNIQNAILFDINEELILVYKVIQNNPHILLDYLDNLKSEYSSLNEEKQTAFFYKIRNYYNLNRHNFSFNKYSDNWIPRAAQMIFLNKTCFNGLFRLNSKGEFNVPFGKYKNPQFYDRDNILGIASLLQKVDLCVADFSFIKKFNLDNSFIYFDPPYRPISKTASFTSYSKYDFNDSEQIRLANLFKSISYNNTKLMLSNSDPKNLNPDDNFFEIHYKDFNIQRVFANRMINSNGNNRGKIYELIITNY